jgi:hypothetical protein
MPAGQAPLITGKVQDPYIRCPGLRVDREGAGGRSREKHRFDQPTQMRMSGACG